MAETLDLLGTADGFHGDRVNAVQHLGQAIELFRTLGDDQSLASSLAARAIQSGSQDGETIFHALRTRDDCVQDATEALHLYRQMDSLSGQAFAEIALSEAHSCFGELGQALTHAQEALRIATAIEHKQWMAVTSYSWGDTYLLLLQPDMAIAALEFGLSLARSLGSAFLTGILTALQGLANCLGLGRACPRTGRAGSRVPESRTIARLGSWRATDTTYSASAETEGRSARGALAPRGSRTRLRRGETWGTNVS